jgi:hypothetical protein
MKYSRQNIRFYHPFFTEKSVKKKKKQILPLKLSMKIHFNFQWNTPSPIPSEIPKLYVTFQ